MQCPDKAWFCGGGIPKRMSRSSVLVERTRVKDIVLDTGFTRTMVRCDLVPEDKLIELEAVAVRCAHGDTVLNPLAEEEMELGSDRMVVTAAVADRLPVSVPLGMDVRVLGKLLHGEHGVMHSHGVEEALVVTTRSRARQEERDELEKAQKEALSCGVPKPLELTSPTVSGGNGEASAEEVVWKASFHFQRTSS
uniref:Peptidase A2 domain-containing protein n=1 Tax=Amphimedon queenslandica TaxID=400682 RepID=A0A1X7UQR1_AMPQE